ncbi:DUF7373 family lipoprotein [Kitasatospora cineracea]|uniref:DUF7373 domain-containing protein n=1 Tax=Kitasatospora cineracea TaxID=88074 RepID=A0A8G1UD79_9ACTN|nr:hypothetical protein [Kitasatospora cineracea]ROR33994.1 hypothetical protein EDD39_7555 [Kitasatospora cineracea]
MHRLLAGPVGAQHPASGVLDLDGAVNAVLGKGTPAAEAELRDQLSQQGFVVGAGLSWTAADGSRSSTLLMRFSAETGAGNTADRLAGDLRNAHPDTVFTDPGDLSTGAVSGTPDEHGNACVVLVAPHGDAVVLVSYFAPTPDKAAAVSLLHRQLQGLPTPGLPW